VRRYETKSEFALRALREAILTGELAPGRRLEAAELAAELGISPTPVREALRVLQADRLVTYQPHRGAVVAAVSDETLAEIFSLRLALEPLAVGIAVARLTNEQLDVLAELHAAVVDAGEDSSAAFAERNAAWHWFLYDTAGATYLIDFIRRLWDAFPWRTILALERRRLRAVQEHGAIMKAIRAKDGAAAAAAMRKHIETSRVTLRVPVYAGVDANVAATG
jgi:DNA-binding GntR family transcriptional regulator